MLVRAVSLVLVEAMVSSTTVQPAHLGRIVAARPADPVQTLHREGEELYDSGDYGGAREAWVGAYTQVEPTAERWPYRTTLLSLIVTTTLAEFSAGGDREHVRDVATLLDEALEADLDDELRELVEAERERLDPYLDPEPPPPSEAAPDDVQPVDQPPPAAPKRTIPNAVWVAGGGALLAGGVAGIIIGSRFTPRAEQMVIDSGMPADQPPSSTFLDEERSKGNAWMIAGGAIAAVGTAALIVGIVRLIRDR